VILIPVHVKQVRGASGIHDGVDRRAIAAL
jgi:hypothetical protein